MAATWNMFGKDPKGSLYDWSFGVEKAIVFEQPGPAGIKSKVWATGPGLQHAKNDGTVYNVAFAGVKIGGKAVGGSCSEELEEQKRTMHPWFRV